MHFSTMRTARYLTVSPYLTGPYDACPPPATHAPCHARPTSTHPPATHAPCHARIPFHARPRPPRTPPASHAPATHAPARHARPP